jgi:hypothetical protein
VGWRLGLNSEFKNETDAIIVKTKKWIEETVIGLNLCPFAKPVHVKNQIRYFVSAATQIEDLIGDLLSELQFLNQANPSDVATSILIVPNLLQDFLDYNDFLDVADAALVELDLVGEIQIASFHPNYQFAGTQADDVENYTNRSPYPILHLIRESSIDEALSSYPNADKIPDRNIATLRSMSPERLQKLKNLLV